MGRRREQDSNISKLRQDAGLSQAELADLLGVSRSTVKNWESGKLQNNLIIIVKLCRVLRCSLLDLLD